MSDPLTPHAPAESSAVRRTHRLRALLLLGLLAIVLVAAALVVFLQPHSTGQRIGVGEVLTLAKDKRVVAATFRDQDSLVVGKVKAGRGVVPAGGTFSAELPSNGKLTASFIALLAATGADVDVDHQPAKEAGRLLLITLLPVLALTDLVALVLLASPVGERLAHPHVPRGKHDRAAPTEPVIAVDLAPQELPAPAEVQADVVAVRKAPAKRAAARTAAPRRTPAKRAPAAAPAEATGPVKKPTARKAPAKTPAKAPAKPPAKAAAKAPAKARPAEDVLPVKRTTRRTQG